MLDYKLFLEKNFTIDLKTNQTDYTYIGRNNGRFNRLKHLIYQIEQSGSPLEGEKVSEILLGAVNLNTLNLSYPFVDVKVITAIPGVTEENELISVKTSRDMHNLKDTVNYVNGFKISQLIQFAITKINLKIFKSEPFKERFAMKLSSITSYYENTINQLFSDDINVYTYAFVNSIVILNFLKEYFTYLKIDHIIEKDRNVLYAIMSVCIASFIDKKFNTNYIDRIIAKIPEQKLNEIKVNVQKFMSTSKFNFNRDFINYGDSLPSNIKNLKVSYCVIYFDESNDKVVLNLHKTHSISFGELFNNSMKIWIRKGYHMAHNLGVISTKKLVGKQNLYLKYEDVIEAFSTKDITGPEVFKTHIRVQFDSDWNYKEREESVKKLYVKVIDNIKGIDNDETQTKILKMLNKFLRKINTGDKHKRNEYIQKFSEIFGSSSSST